MNKLIAVGLLALGFGIGYKGYEKYKHSKCLTDQQERYETLLIEITAGEEQCDSLDDLKQEQTNCLLTLKDKLTKELTEAKAEFEKRGCSLNE